jgi:25S rRNA (cytosine2870-C5)-methyltransferase
VTVEENEGVVAYALSRRPNVRLVETGLPFGKEGFTSFMGKKYDASLRLTRRFYPHHQNVDGFFVAKFKKFSATPANAVLANGIGAPAADAAESGRLSGEDGEEVVDKTPIGDADATTTGQGDDFGGFDDEEDARYMERARKNAMRRRGMDPRAVNGKKATGESRKAPK